ncbi:hypothetical protein C8R45DRAFT_1108286 [Mycena sanguinolenta]|nr:hypothetical protein C8R45DRAFT_1108286 [Mycena sanguinolenta]
MAASPGQALPHRLSPLLASYPANFRLHYVRQAALLVLSLSFCSFLCTYYSLPLRGEDSNDAAEYYAVAGRDVVYPRGAGATTATLSTIQDDNPLFWNWLSPSSSFPSTLAAPPTGHFFCHNLVMAFPRRSRLGLLADNHSI